MKRLGTRTRALLVALGTLVLLAAVSVAALGMGIVQLTPGQVLQALFDPAHAEVRARTVVWSIRLPRIVVAMLVGAALAATGCVMQALLRNPLADPGVTGVSSGAAAGAVAGITLGVAGTEVWSVPLAAFAGAALVTMLLQLVLRSRRELGNAAIILVGVSLSAFAGAIISVLLANTREDSLVRGALFWLAGDLELRNWQHVAMAVAPIVLGVTFFHVRLRQLDALSLGEEIAATSGVDVPRERTVMLLVASLVTGTAVAVSGVISFVGLVVPHAVRLLVGASHARLLPLSALGGALFLVAADTAARSVFGSAVVQTGVVAALVGSPIFLALVLRKKRV